MTHDRSPLPPLPPHWAFEPRAPLHPLEYRSELDLPGLGADWSVCTTGGLLPNGDPLPLSGVFGRGGIFRIGDTVLRPYRRGGFLRHVNERTYGTHHRFAAELAIHRRLWEAGFPTVEPLGYAWRPRGLGVEGVLFTRLAEAETWPQRWDLSSARGSDIQLAIASLCEWGLWSPDLNATNVMFPPQGGVLFLDWDRARFERAGDHLWQRYRIRLLRSLRKLGAPAQAFGAIGPQLRP
jgi:hypothetical protein